MANCKNRYNSFACGFGAILISIIIGIIIGVLYAFGYIPGIRIAVWIAFGLGVLGLIILVTGILAGVSAKSKALMKCLQLNVYCLLAGIWGTILSGLAALSIVLNPSILIAILIGIGGFFFSLMVIALILTTLCVVTELSTNIRTFSDS